jgi:very-short-patch-repair endonuclease
MRSQLLKLVKENSTKAERRFSELLKQKHIKFKTKVKIQGREIDFLIGKIAIDIDCHSQDSEKNQMLIAEGFTPIHLFNREVKGDLELLLNLLKCQHQLL